MRMRAEIMELVRALDGEFPAAALALRDEELAELEAILRGHPEVWPVGLVDTFRQLRRKLRWESIDRTTIPAPLVDFFDAKFRRDLDPMALARHIGQDLCASCQDCTCRC